MCGVWGSDVGERFCFILFYFILFYFILFCFVKGSSSSFHSIAQSSMGRKRTFLRVANLSHNCFIYMNI